MLYFIKNYFLPMLSSEHKNLSSIIPRARARASARARARAIARAIASK